MKEPYFVTGNGKLYCDDALKILSSLPSEYIDVVITDPPYGVLKENENYNDGWDTFLSEEDFWNFTQSWLRELFRVMKEKGSMYIFWSQKRMFEIKSIIEQSGFVIQRMLIWYHPNLANPTRSSYLYTYDPIFFVTKGKTPKYFDAEFTKRHNADVFIFPKPQNWKNGKQRYHPCQKPIELIKILLKNSSEKHDMICDPFVGSGTTIIAAETMNRKWIGIEKNSTYCEITKLRIEKEKNQKKLDQFFLRKKSFHNQ